MTVLTISADLFRIMCVLLLVLCVHFSLANDMDSEAIESHVSESAIIQHYSIIQDLRNAFSVYSTLHNPAINKVRNKTAINQDSLRNDTESPFINSFEYPTNATLFNHSYLDARFSINSFDLSHNQSKFINHNPNIHTESLMQAINPITQDSVQHNQANTADTPFLKIIPTAIEPPLDIALLSPTCKDKTFNLSKTETLDSKMILSQLAKECSFSIQYSPSIKQISDTSVINVKQQTLQSILDLLLKDMFYEVYPNRLVLKETDMRIFELNYVSSTRMAQSNTDVLFSQEQNSNYSSYGTPYQGYNSLYGNNYMGGYNTGNYYMPNANPNLNAFNSSFIQGIIEGNLLKQQLRSQMNNNITEFGKSGTKIYSLDETNFWTDIESRLNVLLDTKLGDKFIIDKATGLISVWTNKKRMQEVFLFLAYIKSKMNLQVAIDVEILSLTHFNSSSVGIDWQEIFRILNPTQSSYNLIAGRGSAIFTLQNTNNNLNVLFNFLRTYGNLRSLSNPKIMALNNQPAIISVGSVLRYSQELVYQSNNANNTIQNTSTQYPSVFAGILLDITPSISQDDIILRINPAITKTKDPELENAAQALSSPPNLSTNQLSSIVKLKDGQRIIIGGLLSNVNQNTTQGIPKLGEMKGLKRVFGKETKAHRSEELIIIITPKIVR
ncbi:secretin N-terminal domain-containing protein [Helicobacter sp. MIT 14-3879]|uniref:secretin N-terminal domain-containing protein n=1 Tax=Helicobacter sp. MIT 14-3879 TaxID=2040649 RepID=UPI0015F17D43|nr:secretin N-terminal domain-containing protein [Helicobacter sp. MIT 14-3879]